MGIDAKLIGGLLALVMAVSVTAGVTYRYTHNADQVKYDQLKAAQDKAVADAKDAASKAQKQADANLLKQKQDALDAANQAVADAQSREASRVHTISTLEARIKANEQDKDFAQWVAVPIRPQWLDGLCFYGPEPSAGCHSDQDSLPAHPGSGH